MSISLNKILKNSNVLYLSSNDKLCKKTINTLKIFFKKIIFRDNINKAIDAFDNLYIHLIITEIDLYESNGINFIKQIRKANKSIPIIVLTENKDIEILLEAIKLNLTDYLIKPVDINKLIQALNNSAKTIYNSGEIAKDVASENGLKVLEGTIATGDQFVHSTERKDFIESTFNADALEMEGASVAVVCDALNVPFFILRAISDSADMDAGFDFDEFLKSSAKTSAEYLIKIVDKLQK